nr:WD repeat-containing protein YMR102C [Ipomoea batatas]
MKKKKKKKKKKKREKVGGANALSEEINRIMVSNGPVLLNSMSKDKFSFSQSSALSSSKESGSHADFKFGSGNTDCEMNCNVRSLAEHFMSRGGGGAWW